MDIEPKHLEIIQNILENSLPPGSTVWVFGSRAKNHAKKFSDLDLAIDAKQPLSMQLMAQLAFTFEESLLPYKVDIIDWLTIDEGFRNNIINDRVLLWKNNNQAL